jgi:hypothetical protein
MVPEEQNIHSDDKGCQQEYVKYGRIGSHFSTDSIYAAEGPLELSLSGWIFAQRL